MRERERERERAVDHSGYTPHEIEDHLWHKTLPTLYASLEPLKQH